MESNDKRKTSSYGDDLLTEEERKKSYLTQAVLQKKRSLYQKVPLNLNQVNIILIGAALLLLITIVLIILEATGTFYLFPKH